MDIVPWGVAAPAVGSAFLDQLVEVVEAFTIVLAVATMRGWRPAFLGAAPGSPLPRSFWLQSLLCRCSRHTLRCWSQARSCRVAV
jgi:hypothetical protein